MKRRQYYEMEGFEEAYLEDSYVLGIEETKNAIEFQMEIVLREKHPLYTPHLPNERYCYRKAKIGFTEIKKITWNERNIDKARSIDAAGEVDYGNIDYFYEEHGIYVLGGDWGEVSIDSDRPEIQFAEI